MMPVIINNGDAMADTFGFKASSNTAKIGQRIANRVGLDVHFEGDGNRREAILYIMVAKHRKANIGDGCGIAGGAVG